MLREGIWQINIRWWASGKKKDKPWKQLKLAHWQVPRATKHQELSYSSGGQPTLLWASWLSFLLVWRAGLYQDHPSRSCGSGWIVSEHLGRFEHASESSHTCWAWCPGTAQYSLPALWFLTEYGLFAVFQGSERTQVWSSLPCFAVQDLG